MGGNFLNEYLMGKITRGQMLRAATAGVAVATLPVTVTQADEPGGSYPYYPNVHGRYTPESIPDILNTLITISDFAAAAIWVALLTPDAYGLKGLGLTVGQSIAAAEQYHADFLASLGAVPVTTNFTIPKTLVNNPAGFLAAAEISATLQVSMYMTAVREFAELGQPELAKWAYQTGAQEAEQRATLRTLEALAGVPSAAIPLNKAFETDLFLHVRDALGVYRALGLIGGDGIPFQYPGRNAVLIVAGPVASAMLQKTPNNASTTITLTPTTDLTGERP